MRKSCQLNHARPRKTQETFGIPTRLSQGQEVLESILRHIRTKHRLQSPPVRDNRQQKGRKKRPEESS